MNPWLSIFFRIGDKLAILMPISIVVLYVLYGYFSINGALCLIFLSIYLFLRYLDDFSYD